MSTPPGSQPVTTLTTRRAGFSTGIISIGVLPSSEKPSCEGSDVCPLAPTPAGPRVSVVSPLRRGRLRSDEPRPWRHQPDHHPRAGHRRRRQRPGPVRGSCQRLERIRCTCSTGFGVGKSLLAVAAAATRKVELSPPPFASPPRLPDRRSSKTGCAPAPGGCRDRRRW